MNNAILTLATKLKSVQPVNHAGKYQVQLGNKTFSLASLALKLKMNKA